MNRGRVANRKSNGSRHHGLTRVGAHEIYAQHCDNRWYVVVNEQCVDWLPSRDAAVDIVGGQRLTVISQHLERERESQGNIREEMDIVHHLWPDRGQLDHIEGRWRLWIDGHETLEDEWRIEFEYQGG